MYHVRQNLQELDTFHVDDTKIQGGFFHWYPPKKLKYVKPRLGESTLT